MIIQSVLLQLLPIFAGIVSGGTTLLFSRHIRRQKAMVAALEREAEAEMTQSWLKDEDREYFETWDRILNIYTEPVKPPKRTPPPGGGGVSAPKGGSGQSHADVGNPFYDRGISKAIRETDQEAFERKWDAEARAKGYNVPARNISIDRCTGDAKVVEPKSHTPKEQREIARNERWLADRNRKALSTIGAVESHTEAISSISEATDAIDMLGDMITVIRDGLAIVIPEGLLEIGDQVIPTAAPPVIGQASHYHEMLKKEAETVQLLRAENERIQEQIVQLRKLHLDVKARDLAVSPDDSPEERMRKLREYRRSRSQTKHGITPRSTDS